MDPLYDIPVLATLGRLSAELTAGASSQQLVELLVDDLFRPYGPDFSIRYDLPPAARQLTLP
ncbi:hypothetical protein SAMN05661080_03833 [Modestobacter sp. DSM 44400]|uniref:hypothetical protein n=1 Tax=Modestobacter sp. DSM 44400 TaxID=1550230 RepID=UPI000899D62A|nr:hypothetical protein [Modestobacter sp. DSM 44400]SDY55262.1 hypothetical protein SAMN05661080_03833 [Modestobacter sp. DSM 44400]